MPQPVMSVEELQAFLIEHAYRNESRFVVDHADGERTRLRTPTTEADGRAGGTVSGPTTMALVDAVAWVAVLACVGPEAMAVTTTLHIDFLRKPTLGRDLIAEATLVKLGRRLGTTSVGVWSDGTEKPVAWSQVTYALP